jgi:hypothetical protein
MSPIILVSLLALTALGFGLLKLGFWLNHRHEPIVSYMASHARSARLRSRGFSMGRHSGNADDEVISISLFLSELERARRRSQQHQP